MRFAFLFPRFKILSGAERLILKLSSSLAESGHEIHLHCHQFDDSCRPLLHPGIGLHVSGIRLDYFGNRYLNAAMDYFRSGRLLGQLSSDLDAVCCFGPALTAAGAVKRKRDIPVLYFCYEPPRFLYTDRRIIQSRLGAAGVLAGPLFALYRRRDRSMVAGVDAVLSNSEFGARQIREIYGRAATVITHGLEPFRQGMRRDSIRAGFGIRPEDIAVLTVNYLHPRKRIDLYLESLRRAQSRFPRLRGIVVGEGPEMTALRKSAPDGVVFAGFVPEAELFEYYQAADIYLHTARLETFGLSVIEAAGNRLPVVSVNEGGPQETVVDGSTGLLREADPAVLGEALAALAQDPESRRRMGAHGYEYVRNKYSWERGAQDFVGALEALKKG